MPLAPAVDGFAEFSVGQSAAQSHPVSSADVVLFAAVTGDLNPVHVDDAYAASSRFGSRIVHGMLTMGYVSGLLARTLPGPGAIILSHSVRFLRPVHVGEVVTVRVEVVEIMTAKRRLRLSTTCRNVAGDLLSDGEALMLVPAAG